MTGSNGIKVGDRFDTLSCPAFELPDAERYAHASLDDNVIHLDADIARQAGFEAPIVHGMLIYAKLEQAARTWCPNGQVCQLTTQFARPLLHGQAYTIEGRVVSIDDTPDKSEMVIRAMARTEDGKAFCIGEISVWP